MVVVVVKVDNISKVQKAVAMVAVILVKVAVVVIVMAVAVRVVVQEIVVLRLSLKTEDLRGVSTLLMTVVQKSSNIAKSRLIIRTAMLETGL